MLQTYNIVVLIYEELQWGKQMLQTYNIVVSNI